VKCKIWKKLSRKKLTRPLWSSVKNSTNTIKRESCGKRPRSRLITTRPRSPKKITLWKACSVNFKRKRKRELALEQELNLTWAICSEEPIYPRHRRAFWSSKLRLSIDSNTMLRPRYFINTIYKTGAMMQKKIFLWIQTFIKWPITNYWRFYQKSTILLSRLIYLAKIILSWLLFSKKKCSAYTILSWRKS